MRFIHVDINTINTQFYAITSYICYYRMDTTMVKMKLSSCVVCDDNLII